MEHFHSRGHELCKFIRKKKGFTQEKISTATELGFWDTNMTAVKLFWGNNVVDVTSREKGIHVYNAEKSRFVHEVSYSSQ